MDERVKHAIAKAREHWRRQQDVRLPIAERLTAPGFVEIQFDPVAEAKRLGIDPADTAALRAGRAQEANDWLRSLPQRPTPMPDRFKHFPGKPRPHFPPPQEQWFYLGTPDSLEPGDGCVADLGPTTVGVRGGYGVAGGFKAQPQQPNGADAWVNFSFDPPGEGIIYVSAKIAVSGFTQAVADNHLKFKVSFVCRASQIDHGESQVTPVDIDSGNTTSACYWYGGWYSLPFFGMWVEPVSATVPPVVLRAGVVISASAADDGDWAEWQFCPGVTVEYIAIDWIPASAIPPPG